MSRSALSLTDAEFTRLTSIIHGATGMSFGEAKRYYVERRVGDRIQRTGVSDPASYIALLARDPTERQTLINAFTINETYFFREEHQLRALADDLLPAIVANKRPGDLVRIWSMPCSTGDEPYSIAIWLLEHWPMVDAYNVEIVGSDIDTAALEAAAAGYFSPRALGKVSPDLIDRYFEPVQQQGRKIIDDLRESVIFTPANLVERGSVRSQGRFDIVFCRNLLIYFDAESRDIAADNLFDALMPGGFLALGHSESMARISDNFEMVRLRDAIVYRKPL
jgi:chemotaxis protein methyltransferase CheR